MSVKTEPIVFNHQYQSNNQEISEVTTSEDDSNFTIRLNSQELFLPLIIRTALDGDRMTIKNMQGTKKIKDIYTDCKLPKIKRLQQFVLLDSKNNIIWLPGLKKSKFAKEKNEKYDIILKYKKEGEMFDE
jgi:tRNA(Ile)-lysidine synthase